MNASSDDVGLGEIMMWLAIIYMILFAINGIGTGPLGLAKWVCDRMHMREYPELDAQFGLEGGDESNQDGPG